MIIPIKKPLSSQGVSYMECKLELSVFRFDATTDFLPYYKKHILKVDLAKTVNDLFALIHAEDLSFGYPTDTYAAIKINGKALYTNVLLEEVVEHFGKSLTLEPLSTKRAVKDMMVDQQDFEESFDLLASFVDAKDKPLFQSYCIYHYASSVHEFIDGFQGDALFAFAYDMIQKHPEFRREILKTIAHADTGVFLHVKLCNKIYPCAKEVEQKISEIKNLILSELPTVNASVEKLTHRIESL